MAKEAERQGEEGRAGEAVLEGTTTSAGREGPLEGASRRADVHAREEAAREGAGVGESGSAHRDKEEASIAGWASDRGPLSREGAARGGPAEGQTSPQRDPAKERSVGASGARAGESESGGVRAQDEGDIRRDFEGFKEHVSSVISSLQAQVTSAMAGRVTPADLAGPVPLMQTSVGGEYPWPDARPVLAHAPPHAQAADVAGARHDHGWPDIAVRACCAVPA